MDVDEGEVIISEIESNDQTTGIGFQMQLF